MTKTDGATRRVRPWLAGLLTFLGWGVGFYYTGRSRAAWLWAFAGVIFGVILGVGLLLYSINARSAWLYSAGPGPLTLLSLGVTTIVAAIAWIVAARNKTVAEGRPARRWGYLLILLVPLLASLLITMPLRFFVIQPFRMPSGSMQPTINVGDYMVVTKGSYGYSRFSFAPFESLLPHGRWRARLPERGDLVVFRPTPEPTRDFVKRVVGLPGDQIQVIGGVLHINGVAARRQSLGMIELDSEGMTESIAAFRETLPNRVSYVTLDRDSASELDNTQVFVVPLGHYFMMGDDRDNSADSRVLSVVGYVPYENLIGRVDHILVSRR